MKRRTLVRLLKGLGISLLVFLGAFKSAEWFSDAWLSSALGQGATYATIFQYRFVAFVCGAVIWAAIWGSNLRLAWFYVDDRALALELLGPGRRGDLFPQTRHPERGLARARRLSSKIAFWGLIWLAGLAAANRFDLWLPLSHLSPLGQTDPVSGRDLSFFFWVLPALEWSWNFFGFALIATIVACFTLYSSADLIETGPQMFRVAARAAWHLLTLGAVLVLWQGVHQGLEILSAPISYGWNRGTIFGAAEAHFTIPTRLMFLVSSLPVAGFVLLLSRRGRMNAASGLLCGWMVGALVLPWLAAPFGRSLRIKNETEQLNAIDRHIKATRAAWGITDVPQRTLNVPPQPQEVGNANAPLTSVAFPQVAIKRDFGQFPAWPASVMQKQMRAQDTNSDRRMGALHLEVSGGRLVYRGLATNSSATSDAPAVLYEADATSTQPPITQRTSIGSLLVGEFIETPDISTSRYPQSQEVYGGTLPTTIVPLPRWRTTLQTRFAIDRESLWHRLALGLRFFDTSLLSYGDAVSWQLDPISRAKTLLPFVDWHGADPRTIVVGSGTEQHLFWLLNGSFSSRFYPNSAMLPVSGERREINYLREGVVCVIDATTGETTFYLLDPNEPLTRGWKRTFPSAFRELADLRPELRSQIQPSPTRLDAIAQIWTRYHSITTGSETKDWSETKESWRSLFTKSNLSLWSAVLPPGETQLWMTCPFTLSNGRTTSTSASLISVLALPPEFPNPGTTSARRPGYVEWRPQTPLDMPSFALPASLRMVGTTYPLSTPAITSIFPLLNGQSEAMEGLLLSHGSLASVSSGSATSATPAPETPAPTPDANGDAATKVTTDVTKIEIHYALWGTSRPVQAPKEKVSLAQVRLLWSQLLRSRRTRNWSEVARLELELSHLLGVPLDSSTP